MELIERYRGSLLGLAAGDALGDQGGDAGVDPGLGQVDELEADLLGERTHEVAFADVPEEGGRIAISETKN